ncbi:uncharacterized protein LOC111829310 [Capsella rubella]|uniref:uncharacterized protein LOC111829310 n=1 Tax=Capsella rubella TaxID=81985 RepID=UPI000CD5AD57|nr:uncharacterized protein LOC111829310 [Capsella rubella]
MVFWIIDKEEPIPSPDEFLSTYENINTYLFDMEGIRGQRTLRVYVLKPGKKLPQEYWDAYDQFLIRKGTEGNEGVRFERMLLDILLFSFLDERNFLILSRNKDFGHGTKFFSVRDTLGEKGIHVAVAHPDYFNNITLVSP